MAVPVCQREGCGHALVEHTCLMGCLEMECDCPAKVPAPPGGVFRDGLKVARAVLRREASPSAAPDRAMEITLAHALLATYGKLTTVLEERDKFLAMVAEEYPGSAYAARWREIRAASTVEAK